MSTRRTRTTIADEAAAGPPASAARTTRRSGREIEHMPPLSAGSEHWRDRVLESQAEGVLQHERGDAIDFDIAAWFALEEQNAHDRCIAECWYG